MTDVEEEQRPKGRLILHPFLLAAWPVLFLLSANLGEAEPGEALPVLAGTVLGAAVLFGLVRLVVRDGRRAGLVTSALVLGLLTFGHVANLAGDPAWLPAAWLAGVVVLVVLAVRARRGPELTRVANAVAGILVVVSLVSIVASGQVLASAGAPAPEGDRALAWEGPGEPRDVYYLVFDRYGSAASLRERFGLDNEPFLRQLEDRGLTVVRNARANHLRTAQSVASTLRMDYLLDLAEEQGPDTGNLRPVRALLRDARVGRLFQSAGYRYVHIGSWWDMTAASDIADANRGYESGASDFLQTFTETTALTALPEAAQVAPPLRVRHHDAALLQLEHLSEVARDPRPTFTFAHVLLPHPPYVFDAAGNVLTEPASRELGVTAAFEGQLAYTNARILELLDGWLSLPEEEQPIVILQADEGPHPPGNTGDTGFAWEQATDAALLGKFGILDAWYVPPGLDVPLGDVHTPVNTFRLLFDALYGGDFGLLPERSYIFRDVQHIYAFTDVTDRLEAAIRA